jgi:spore coat protein A, manganese oxidase
VGTKIVLKNAITFFGNRAEVMRFDVTKKAHGNVHPVPKKLVPLQRLNPARATKHRTFELKFNPAAGQMLINGQIFDPDRIDIKPRFGATEIWTVRNAETAELPIPHVFHTHLVRFQILDRDGKPAAPHEAGWKDSVTVEAGQSVRLIMKFGDFTGRFLYHCHLLGHADAGMMAQMEVVR